MLMISAFYMKYYRRQELLTLRKHLGSPLGVGGVRIAHLFSFLCCGFYFLRPVSCGPSVASVSGFIVHF